MDEDSVAATVFSYSTIFLVKSMLHAWDDVAGKKRCKLYERTYRLFTLENLYRVFL